MVDHIMKSRVLPALAIVASLPLLLSAVAPASDLAAEMQARLTPEGQQASACGPASSDKATTPMPLVAGLAPIDYPVTTASPEAQRYFNQGIALLYGFEYAKAERSFKAGSAIDPGCAMCLWGEALAIGPFLNSDAVGVETIARARLLTEQALGQPGISTKERALITALRQRYEPKGRERGVHGITFADALLAVSFQWPEDDMIMVLAAEAAMNVHPWNYWAADNATPLPWAKRAIDLVEKVLARNPTQPEAQHLYIHLTEASMSPGRAERAADMLARAAPASAHLVHMPSHTYYRIGRFRDAVDANHKAIAADEAMARRLSEDPKYYGYFNHHTHFILSAAEQVGDRRTALAAADSLEASNPPAKAGGNSWRQGYLATALQARAQFAADVAEVLAIPEPDARMPDLRLLWRAKRAEALGRAGRKAEAMHELAALRAARARARPHGDFVAMVKLAETIAMARIAEGSGNARAALRHLNAAAAIERRFSYNEPPIWHQPVDSAVGALLLRTGDAPGARAAFDRALLRRPGNVWAYWGRAQAEAALGDKQASAATLVVFRKLWAGESEVGITDRL
jgi:tetratricopeptide (TPR) repeat protein